MSRIKLNMPGAFFYSTEVRVRITDINYGNHVGNDAFVGIIHEARMQWLKENGFTELDINGTGLIMSDLAVEFKQESFYGDTILVRLGVADAGRVNFDLYYELSVTRNNETILLANAKTAMVAYDYTAKKVAMLPAELKKMLKLV